MQILIYIVVILLAFCIAIAIYKATKRVVAKSHNKNSLLNSFYSAGNIVILVDAGVVNKMKYDTCVTVRGGPLFGKPKAETGGAVIYRVELPFNTQAHLVGLCNKKTEDLDDNLAKYIKNIGLQPINLEGDFNNYFTLYTPKEQVRHAYYVFDPAAMQFVVDFCAEHDWEIVYDELYFTVSKSQDSGAYISKSIEFVNQIEPAIINKFSTQKANHIKTPYGKFIGDPLKCPICDTAMQYDAFYHICPNGHGRLVKAQHMIKIRSGIIKNIGNDASDVTSIRNNSLVCPFCQNQMIPTKYNGVVLTIDSCPKCPYRWFDAGELAKILPKKTLQNYR